MDLRERARELRANQSDVERLLWRALRNRRLEGYRFRRQARVGPYIVDFLCVSRRMVIELDGGQHASDSSRDYDELRSQYLVSRGYTVLRFWNDEVLRNLDPVLQTILIALKPRPNT